LFFLQGVKLADPAGLLKGSGKQMRSIVLEDAAVLDKPAVRTLIAQGLDLSGKTLDATEGGRIVIKFVSAKQRPRRPAARSTKAKNKRRGRHASRTRPRSPVPTSLHLVPREVLRRLRESDYTPEHAISPILRRRCRHGLRGRDPVFRTRRRGRQGGEDSAQVRANGR